MKNIKGLTKKETLAILEYEKLLLERFPKRLKKLILFGSKARGNSNRSSDLDILVVLTKNGKRARQEIASLTHNPIIHFKVLISPIIVEEKFFKKWSPLLSHIKKEGITIWVNKRA
ncbi:MAG: nucleotidyltransferase domain-containing protein [Candidatus Omnitrophota bacterium]|nr:MAG: nucleotidyltransferase domain-containing protein [Candidatus Omnitrophota bacterium]